MRATELISKIADYAAIGREAFEYSAVRAPEIVGKAIGARLHYDLGPVDFFLYDLINRPRSTWRDYLREHPHNDRMLRILHPFATEFVVRDKALAAERCREHGVAIVPITAIVGRAPDRMGIDQFPVLNDAVVLQAEMRAWPGAIFVKPVAGSFGEDAMALDRDAGGWRDGSRRWSDAELAALLLGRKDPAGTLVQPRLRNDPGLRRISCGNGLCATRIITALTTDGPEVLVTVHKLLGRDVIADNFSAGVTGNLLAVVEPATGRLSGAYGRRSGHRFLLTRHATHPATGAQLTGFRMPHWEATRRLAMQAAAAFPELPLLGHDIVITEDGPLFLETNTHWRVSLPQLALGGLRPILRELIPRLAVPPDARAAALAAIG